MAGAMLLRLQPIGIPTASGRVGGAIVHWGFRVGRGRLLPAVLVSWLVWILLGGAIIGLTHSRSQPLQLLMLLAWTVDGAALFRVLGIAATNRSSGRPVPRSLLLVATVLVLMLAVSAALWWYAGSAPARVAALVVAGGPPLLVGVGYGLLTGVMLIGGRHGKWK
jgi:hypothetical protein